MKLSEIRELLARDGIQLTKSLGQNFLHDANQLRRIVEAAELTKQDKVLEIGPGLGSLTGLLLERAGEVLAIEKDARLVEVLRERFHPTTAAEAITPALSHPPSAVLLRRTGRMGEGGPALAGPGEGSLGTPNLRLHHDDALEFLKRESRDWSHWKLVANLPYSVASPILVEMACGRRAPQRMVVTLQLEVAKRLVALPGDKDYGVLTLLVQLDFEPHAWFRIPASCFFPEPDVDSACVCLMRRPQSLLSPDQREAFTKIVKRGFSQRRKMMLKLLKEDWNDEALAKAFTETGLQRQTRAEQVGLNEFVQLTQILRASTPRQ